MSCDSHRWLVQCQEHNETSAKPTLELDQFRMYHECVSAATSFDGRGAGTIQQLQLTSFDRSRLNVYEVSGWLGLATRRGHRAMEAYPSQLFWEMFNFTLECCPFGLSEHTHLLSSLDSSQRIYVQSTYFR